jgi:ATP-dependent protease Clp ATPase subunit
MFRRKREEPPDRRCSFCWKPEDGVHQLVQSPVDYPRAFICDECVAVCHSAISGDREQPAARTELMAAMNAWIARETRGLDSSKELAEVRRLAMLILPHDTRMA